jgi:catalase-peroxidase
LVAGVRAGEKLPAEEKLVDRANLLRLTAPDMTVLVGGMCVLSANFRQSRHGVFTHRPETMTNDFFVNLLDMGTEWKASPSAENVFDGRNGAGEPRWTATAVDLVFGSNSQLRGISEV